MGFIKALVQTTKMGYEMQNNWDVGAQLSDAQTSMAQMQQMMAQQTAGANLSVTGLDGIATINAVRQHGGMINMQPIVELDLTVLVSGAPAPVPAPAAAAPSMTKGSAAPTPAATPPAGGIVPGVPYPLVVSQTIEMMYAGRAIPGGRVAVKVDPANPQGIWLNWAAPVG